MIELRTIPYIELVPHYDFQKKVEVRQIMNQPVICFYEIDKVSDVIAVLKDTEITHNGFPTLCVDDEGFNGLILRNTLITLLRNKE